MPNTKPERSLNEGLRQYRMTRVVAMTEEIVSAGVAPIETAFASVNQAQRDLLLANRRAELDFNEESLEALSHGIYYELTVLRSGIRNGVPVCENELLSIVNTVFPQILAIGYHFGYTLFANLSLEHCLVRVMLKLVGDL